MSCVMMIIINGGISKMSMVMMMMLMWGRKLRACVYGEGWMLEKEWGLRG